jgi:hypothetical protein
VRAISPDGYAHRNVAQTGYLGLNDAWLITFQNPVAGNGYGGTGGGDSGGPTLWHDPAIDKDVLVITSWGGGQGWDVSKPMISLPEKPQISTKEARVLLTRAGERKEHIT